MKGGRSHFAIKFTAAIMRIAALLVVIGGLLGALAVTQFQTASATTQLSVAASGAAYVVVLVVTLIYAIILWGFADALVLIADTNDAQRISQQQIAMLMLERRTEPAPYVAPPAAPSDATERLPPPDR